MSLVWVATNPDYQLFQAMKQNVKSMWETISLRLKNLFIQLQLFIENLLKINVADKEDHR